MSTNRTTRRPSDVFIEEDEVTRNKRGIPWIRLEQALHTEGCPLCHLVMTEARKHLTSILHEYVLDVSVRKKLHASFGFCNDHAWLAREVESELHSDGQHLGTLHESIIQMETEALRKAYAMGRDEGAKRRALKKVGLHPIVRRVIEAITPGSECFLCRSSRATGRFYASQCILMCCDNDFRTLFESKTLLLCRRHFKTVLLEAHELNAVDYFVSQQIAKVERLSAQITLFLERHAVERRHEPRGTEWHSWLSALEHCSCKNGVDRVCEPGVSYSPIKKGSNR